MSHPLGVGVTRGARAALVAVVTVGLALTAHVWCGGALPSVAAVGGLLAGTAAVTARLGRRQWTVPRLSALMAVVEGATHVSSPGSSGMSGMHQAAGAGMVAGHLVACTLSVAYLRYAERLLWDLVALLGSRLLTSPQAVDLAVVPGRAPRPAWRRSCTELLAGVVVDIRGPPTAV